MSRTRGVGADPGKTEEQLRTEAKIKELNKHKFAALKILVEKIKSMRMGDDLLPGGFMAGYKPHRPPYERPKPATSAKIPRKKPKGTTANKKRAPSAPLKAAKAAIAKKLKEDTATAAKENIQTEQLQEFKEDKAMLLRQIQELQTELRVTLEEKRKAQMDAIKSKAEIATMQKVHAAEVKAATATAKLEIYMATRDRPSRPSNSTSPPQPPQWPDNAFLTN